MDRLSGEEISSLAPPPRRRFSQNFLVDARVARRIAMAFAPGAEDHVLEVGPGRGDLTRHLCDVVARLVAVEIDRQLGERMRERFPAVEVVSADILTLDLAALRTGPRLRVIANLPYAISSPFLVKLADEADAIEDVQLLLQLEFADRLAARPGTKTFGALTVLAQSSFEVSPSFTVGPAAFRPRPREGKRRGSTV